MYFASLSAFNSYQAKTANQKLKHFVFLHILQCKKVFISVRPAAAVRVDG